ncbi:flagellar hook capping FlgD N-terminal domain-containing protein [Cohnella caldifontis]|uniref:flagellar hook capping FlgD N-terminal domain-containing protein n=1 Tax=Cohnella caldifontis TaxID=3027471 RepID=UPI0023EB57B6|nr:flagellar hook capping FlgD N-terminal domain-containing protein [Cohnella sp. YIM B05605]
MSGSVGTTNIWPYYSAQNVQTAARKPTTELGKDQFLQLLVTQLKNQDPMQPMQDKDFIAQMAQFSALEQTMNMSTELTALRQSAGIASGLLGKTVGWEETTDSGVVQHSGVVQGIVRRDGIQYVKVDGSEVKIDDLLTISDTPSADTGSESGSETGGTGDE